jgi:hypothetical protein
MSTSRVYIDFHNVDDLNRLRLTCSGTLQDLESQGIELREGLALSFYSDDADDQGRPDDLLVDGVVRYSEEEQCWVAEIAWKAIRHASDDKREAATPGADGRGTSGQ